MSSILRDVVTVDRKLYARVPLSALSIDDVYDYDTGSLVDGIVEYEHGGENISQSLKDCLESEWFRVDRSLHDGDFYGLAHRFVEVLNANGAQVFLQLNIKEML